MSKLLFLSALALIAVVICMPCEIRADEPEVQGDSTDYERAIELIKTAPTIKDYGLREKQLDQAQGLLKEFRRKQPKHENAADAANRLGLLLVQRAGMHVNRTKKPPGSGQKVALLMEARGMYEEALKLFATVEGDLKVKLETLPKAIPPAAVKLIDLRDRLRADYMQVQILAAAVKEEMAETESSGSMAYKDILLAAVKDYNGIYERYRTRLAGLYARLYQGRCYTKLNDREAAQTCFDDLLDQPDQPAEFRDLKVRTLVLSADNWLIKMPPDHDRAISNLGKFLDTARPEENTTESFLDLQLRLAKAFLAREADLRARQPKERDEIDAALQKAKGLLAVVAKHPGEGKLEAKRLLAKLENDNVVDPTDKPQPENFAEGKELGKEALTAMQAATARIAELSAQLAVERDAGLKKAWETELEAARQTVENSRADALRYYQRALRLATPEIAVDQIAVVQYFLTYLHYCQGDYHESAALGEHVARRYPDSSGARQAAKIALASYLKLYKDSPDRDKSFESAKITAVAEYILKKWPQEPEALEAINTLIPFSIREGRLDAAQAYLDRIPADHPQRGETELKVGQSLWGEYLVDRKQRVDREPKEPGVVVELALSRSDKELIQRAEKLLSAGLERVRKAGPVSPTVATASLSLAQIYVETEQSAKAISLLEDSKIGPLKLVQLKGPEMQREGLFQETYKTALRAYVQALPTVKATEVDATLKKVETLTKSLQETLGDTPAGREKLVTIFAGLARLLEAKLTAAPDEAKAAISKTIDLFDTIRNK